MSVSIARVFVGVIIPLPLLTDDIECEGSVGPGVKVPLSWLHRRQQAHAAEAFKALALCQGPVLCQQRLANAYVRKRQTSEVNPSIETMTISEVNNNGCGHFYHASI